MDGRRHLGPGRLVVVLTVWSGAGLGHAGTDPVVPSSRPSEEGLTQSELLERATKALSEAKSLSLEMEVVAPPGIRIRADARMAPGKLLSRFYIQDQASEEYAQEKLVTELLLVDGIIREHRLSYLDITGMVVEYRAPQPCGTHSLLIARGIEQYTCLLADVLGSWVGPESKRVREFLPMFILSGELRPDQEVDGRKCRVISWTRPELSRQDVLYFDAETCFMVRWDTLDADVGADPVLSRSRRYKNISMAPLPEETWRLAIRPAYRLSSPGAQ